MLNEYKIIEIIDASNIIINYGKSDGATTEDSVRIIEYGKDVIDPETKENLGNLYLIKDILDINKVYDDFSICNKTISTFQPIFASNFELGNTIYSKKKLNIDEKEMTNRKISTDKKIKVGDVVIVE